jgi:hypothetical protein
VAAVKAASRATLLLSGVAIVLFLASDRLAAELSSPGARGLRIAALIGGLASAGGWLGAMAVIRAARRPRRAQPGPAASDLGPEPPAVANLLVNDFDIEREAAPATLLDLAARRIVSIEEAGESFVCRVQGREGGDLAPYEKRILALVRQRVVGGVVPAGALTAGPRDQATAWWRSFRNEVIDDAQGRGLCRDLWDRRTIRWLSLAALIPAPFFFVAAAHAGGAVAYGIGAAVIIGRAAGHRRQRDTDEGLRAASAWLGVRRFLGEGAFTDLPPTAVAVWERYLSYAAALEVATAVVRSMPMGADEDRRAWSAYDGEWRLVRIRYPSFWPPAWGWRPWVALIVSVVGAVVAFVALRMAAGIGWPEGSTADPPGLVALVRGLFVSFLTVGTILALWSLSTLARAAMDLGRPQERRGLVLRVRVFGRSSRSPGRHYVAVDDGRSTVVRAWRIRPELSGAPGVSEYEEAIATVTRQLRFVDDLRPA